MSSNSTAAVRAAASPAACAAVNRPAASKPEASARWAALDSRHERLVTAGDAVLADLDRPGDRRMAS